jgi:hypothetical protein
VNLSVFFGERRRLKSASRRQSEEAAIGAYVMVVSFNPGDPTDKDVIIQIEDTVTDELLDPPRPWKFSPLTLIVSNGSSPGSLPESQSTPREPQAVQNSQYRRLLGFQFFQVKNKFR